VWIAELLRSVKVRWDGGFGILKSSLQRGEQCQVGRRDDIPWIADALQPAAGFLELVRIKMRNRAVVESALGLRLQLDPENRRINGGGTVRQVLEIIPMILPQILADASGSMITHADFSRVTTAKPAKAGEVLIVKATGLGPTVPGVGPGQPFPLDTVQPVNSPVRVDFRMPAGAASGTAAIQLTAAWIPSATVSIPVQ